jgi:hypothetical protein
MCLIIAYFALDDFITTTSFFLIRFLEKNETSITLSKTYKATGSRNKRMGTLVAFSGTTKS